MRYFFLLVFFSANFYAQSNGSVIGKLTNNELLKYPIDSINIKIKRTSEEVFSDDEGLFKFTNLREGIHTLILKTSKVNSIELPILVVPNKTTIVYASLDSVNNTLDEIIIHLKHNVSDEGSLFWPYYCSLNNFDSYNNINYNGHILKDSLLVENTELAASYQLNYDSYKYGDEVNYSYLRDTLYSRVSEIQDDSLDLGNLKLSETILNNIKKIEEELPSEYAEFFFNYFLWLVTENDKDKEYTKNLKWDYLGSSSEILSDYTKNLNLIYSLKLRYSDEASTENFTKTIKVNEILQKVIQMGMLIQSLEDRLSSIEFTVKFPRKKIYLSSVFEKLSELHFHVLELERLISNNQNRFLKSDFTKTKRFISHIKKIKHVINEAKFVPNDLNDSNDIDLMSFRVRNIIDFIELKRNFFNVGDEVINIIQRINSD